MEEKVLKHKKTKEEIIEIITVIMLGITALLTAWASWIGSLHGGNQATNYTKSTNLAAEGNSSFSDASQSLMQDFLLWNQIIDLRIDYLFASEKANQDEMDRIEWKLSKIYTDRVSSEFQEAIDWADAQEGEGDTSPFEKEGFVESYFTDAVEVLNQSEEVLTQGQADNANGDAFGLVTVIYSVVLFLLGITSTFKNATNKMVVLIIAGVGFVLATSYMFVLPLPTGFSLFGFFG